MQMSRRSVNDALATPHTILNIVDMVPPTAAVRKLVRDVLSGTSSSLLANWPLSPWGLGGFFASQVFAV